MSNADDTTLARLCTSGTLTETVTSFLLNHCIPVGPPQLSTTECPVCLEDYSGRSELAVQITKVAGCKHVFGLNCLTHMLKIRPHEEKKCPLCRAIWIEAPFPGRPRARLRVTARHTDAELASLSLGVFGGPGANNNPIAQGNAIMDAIGQRIDNQLREAQRPGARNPGRNRPERGWLGVRVGGYRRNISEEDVTPESFIQFTRDIADIRERAGIAQPSRPQRQISPENAQSTDRPTTATNNAGEPVAAGDQQANNHPVLFPFGGGGSGVNLFRRRVSGARRAFDRAFDVPEPSSNNPQSASQSGPASPATQQPQSQTPQQNQVVQPNRAVQSKQATQQDQVTHASQASQAYQPTQLNLFAAGEHAQRLAQLDAELFERGRRLRERELALLRDREIALLRRQREATLRLQRINQIFQTSMRHEQEVHEMILRHTDELERL